MWDKINSFEGEITKFIQGIANSFWNLIFQGITFLGDEIFFIAIAVLLYWVVDKRLAYKFILIFLSSAVVNQVFKNVLKRPRPHQYDGIRSIGEPETSYSFPSGHSQSIAVISTSFYLEYQKKYKWLKWVLLALMILVPFSRIYLGQHFLSDVIIGVIIGIIVTIVAGKLFDLMGEREHLYPLVLTLIAIIGFVVLLIIGASEYDKYSKIFATIGGFIGFSSGYFLEKKYLNYDVSNTWPKQIVKILIGGSVAVLLLLINRLLIPQNVVWDFLFYLMMAFWVSYLAPLVFSKIPFLKKEV